MSTRDYCAPFLQLITMTNFWQIFTHWRDKGREQHAPDGHMQPAQPVRSGHSSGKAMRWAPTLGLCAAGQRG